MAFNKFILFIPFVEYIFVLSQENNYDMKPFLILIFVAFLSTFNSHAQNQVETQPVITEVVLNAATVHEDDANNVAAKKKDILNAKINSKLKGEVDLFFIADKSKMC